MPDKLLHAIQGNLIDGVADSYLVYTSWQGGYNVVIERNDRVIGSNADTNLATMGAALAWVARCEDSRERCSYSGPVNRPIDRISKFHTWQAAWNHRVAALDAWVTAYELHGWERAETLHRAYKLVCRIEVKAATDAGITVPGREG